MKLISCIYIVAAVCTVASISLYFAYKKKQEEKKETFRGGDGGGHFGGGEALHYGGGGTEGGPDSASALPSSMALCKSDTDCGAYRKCASNGFCV